MPLYLTPWIGSGIRLTDPFEPKHVDLGSGKWACLDLRPDATQVNGFALLWSDISLPNRPDLRPIADLPGELLTTGRKNGLENALGITLDVADDRATTILARLMFRPWPGRWGQVQISTIRWLKEVVFHGETWALENVPPGTPSNMDPSDTFTGSDSDPIGGNWTTVTSAGSLRRVSNSLAASSTTDSAAYWNADSFANDQFSQIQATTLGTEADWGPAVRCSSSAFSIYFAAAWSPGEKLAKFVSGSYSSVASVTTSNVTTSDTIRIEAEGSTLRWIKNGTTEGSSTDTSLTSGSAGVFIYQNNARLTPWSGGDIGAGGGGANLLTLLGVG